jgi:hypothetical protein
MPTLTAEAQLSFTASAVAITGFINYQKGNLDLSTGTIKPLGRGTWASLSGSTWDTTINWQAEFDEIRWTAPQLDLGRIQYFTLNVESQYTGTIYYIIDVSETGDFSGEESQTTVVNGDQSIPAFYGRYVYVTAVVSGREFIRMTVTANTETVEYLIPDVNTSSLSGSNTARVIPLPTPVSRIKDIQIQPKAATSYAVNLYVSDTATSKVLIPVIESKSNTTPTFALYGIDNDPRDGIVDIQITAMRQMVMFEGNIVVL